jgi:hypothetical protein
MSLLDNISSNTNVCHMRAKKKPTDNWIEDEEFDQFDCGLKFVLHAGTSSHRSSATERKQTVDEPRSSTFEELSSRR